MLSFSIIFAAAGYTLGVGRTIPTVAAVAGLLSVILAGLALARPRLRGPGPPTALVLALISLLVGGSHTSFAVGGVGTGNGLAGAVVAVALGLIGIILGGLAMSRPRRTV